MVLLLLGLYLTKYLVGLLLFWFLVLLMRHLLDWDIRVMRFLMEYGRYDIICFFLIFSVSVSIAVWLNDCLID